MLPGLFDEDRRSLQRIATMLVVGAVGVLPLTMQSSSVAGAADARTSLRASAFELPPRLSFPAYSVSRDPFVPEPAIRAKLARDAFRIGQSGEIGMTSPPNTGAAQGGLPMGATATLQTAPVVRAIVMGDPARALVEEGGGVRVLGVGDRVGELSVVAITADGITLSDGTRLRLEPSHP